MFGKKKSTLPSGTKTRRVTSVETRRVTAPERVVNDSARDDMPDMDRKLELSMREIGRWSQKLLHARGYPDDAVLPLSMAVVWLAERGLPSLGCMAKTIFDQWKTDLKTLGPRAGAGQKLMLSCPLLGSAFMGSVVDDLVAGGPGKKADFICEGPAMLLLPRLSDHARRHAQPLMLHFAPLGYGVVADPNYPDSVVQVILDGTHMWIQNAPGRASQLTQSSHITLRLCPPNFVPPRNTALGHDGLLETYPIQAALLDLITMCSATSDASPAQTAPQPSRIQPVGLAPLEPKTVRFFLQALQADPALRQLYAAISRGNKSAIEAALFATSEGKGLGECGFATTATSPFAHFLQRCQHHGWALLALDQPGRQYGMITYQLTETGRMGLAVMLRG